MTDRPCDLCVLARYTQWYVEFHYPFKFTILDCDSCDLPIAVLGEHRTEVTPEELAKLTTQMRGLTPEQARQLLEQTQAE